MIARRTVLDGLHADQRRFLGLALALGAAVVIIIAPLSTSVALLMGGAFALASLVHPELPLYALTLTVPFGSLWPLVLGGVSLTPSDAVVLVAGIAWTIRGLADRRLVLRPMPLLIPFALLYGAFLLSLFDALSYSEAFKELVKWGEIIGIYVIGTQVITTRRQVAILLIAILAVGVVNGLMGLYQFLFQVGPGGFLIGRFMRAYGTFGQPNPYGGYLNLSLPILYALLLFSISQREQWRYAIPLGIGLAVGGVALMATLSRGAWIGAAMALVTVSLVHSRRSLLITGAVGILSLTVVLLSTASIVPTAVAERLLSVGEYFRIFDVREVKVTDANFSIVERMAHWQAAMGMVEDRPLTGYGIGNYAAAYEAYQLPGWSDPLGHAHNIMLNMAAETGLIGASSYVLLLASALWLIWQRVRSLKGWERSIALGILGVLVAKISHEMLDNLWVHYMGLHIALLLSMVAVLPTVAQEETPTHP